MPLVKNLLEREYGQGFDNNKAYIKKTNDNGDIVGKYLPLFGKCFHYQTGKRIYGDIFDLNTSRLDETDYDRLDLFEQPTNQ